MGGNLGWFKFWRPNYPDSSYYRMTGNQRLVFLELLVVTDRDTGIATIGQELLAKRADVGRRSLRDAIARLVAMGVLEVIDTAIDPASNSATPRNSYRLLNWHEYQASLEGHTAIDPAIDSADVSRREKVDKEKIQRKPRKKKAHHEDGQGSLLAPSPALPVSADDVNSDSYRRRFLNGALPEAIGWLGRTVDDIDRQVANRRLKTGEKVPDIIARAYCGIAHLGAPSVAVALSKAWDGKFTTLGRELKGVAESVQRNADERDRRAAGIGGDGRATEHAPPKPWIPDFGADPQACERALVVSRGTTGALQDYLGLDLGGESGAPGQEGLHGDAGNVSSGSSPYDPF